MNKRNCGAWKHQPLSVSNIEQVSKIKNFKQILVSKFRVALKVLYEQGTGRRDSFKLTPRRSVIFEKLTVPRLAKKCSRVLRNMNVITLLNGVKQSTCPYADLDQSGLRPPNRIKINFKIVLSSTSWSSK